MNAAKKRQLDLKFRMHGGKRRGAGRKPKGERAGVSHARRAQLCARHPVHVTMRVRDGVWSLRGRRAVATLATAFAAGKEKPGFRLVHFSIQGNHLHMVVEADDAGRLSRGLQGLATRIARRLNALMRRRGKVFADRYHARALRTPTEVANALAYVLGNFAVHAARRGTPVPARFVDPCTSLEMRVTPTAPHVPLTAAPYTWLLRIGWQRGVS
jgi:putative transposase